MGRRTLGAIRLFLIGLGILSAAAAPLSAQVPLEDRLVIMTPIPREVADPVADRFAEHARQRYGVALRPTLVSMGGPLMYARVLEWRGRPEADLLWASEAEVLDDLAGRRLIVPLDLPESLIRDVPAMLGEPRPIPLRDSKGHWIGTALTAAGIIYHPRLLRRLGLEPPRDWDDLTDCRYKGQVVQTTPDRSATNHSSLEVILQLRGWQRGWEWAQRLAATTGLYVTRSRDVPTFVARAEFGVGFAVLSYMAFQEVLAGHDLRFVSPPYAWISPAPTAVLAGARAPRAARAFLQYLLSEDGQRVMVGHGLFPIVPKLKMEGPPGSVAARAAAFAGMRSFFDQPVKTIYDDDLAQKRYNEVNELYRKLIVERQDQVRRLYCP
jgi:ABC-type Fe3+ transport system substrate-binding protein